MLHPFTISALCRQPSLTDKVHKGWELFSIISVMVFKFWLGAIEASGDTHLSAFLCKWLPVPVSFPANTDTGKDWSSFQRVRNLSLNFSSSIRQINTGGKNACSPPGCVRTINTGGQILLRMRRAKEPVVQVFSVFMPQYKHQWAAACFPLL